ncbi:MAG: glycosyltransferase family 4 protein [Chloroflexi bacterium]|nr:glycosyltransferase family 4 protein [Chloroflexota bacterium]
MLIHSYHPRVGGAERQVAALIPGLLAQGVAVDVITRRHPGLASYEQIDGVPVHRLPVPGPKPIASLAFTLTALPLLRRLRPDLIHAHELFSTTTTAVAAKRLFDYPVVVTLHGGGGFNEIVRLQKKALGAYRLSVFAKTVDSFVAISRELDAELERIGIPPEHRAFIPNAVDTDHFQPLPHREKMAQRSALGLPDVPLAVFTGRLAPEKRLDRLIAIWPDVRQIHPEACLLILGTGTEAARIERAAGEGVRFLGQVERVLPYLQASDVFVLPSEREGLSVALLEAMSAGLSVLATDVGGTPDVIEHGVTGWLVPPDAPEVMRDGLLTLLTDADLRTRLGRRARECVVAEYSLPIAAARLTNLYTRLATVITAQAAPCK